jgi:hypothetical protein
MIGREVLARCKALDIHLTANGDNLRCDAPTGVLTDDLRALIRDHKAVILAELAAPAVTGETCTTCAETSGACVPWADMCAWGHGAAWERPAAWGGGWVCAVCHPAPAGISVQIARSELEAVPS